jgi:four helix bundle protein
MATIKHFEDILSWQKARELCKITGEIIDKGNFKHSYKLIDQIESSSGSIMDNIAEGFERGGNKEFIHFLYISKGSCGEFRSQLYRAIDRNYLTQSEFDLLYNLAKEIIVLLQKLIDYLHKSELKGSKFKPTHEQKLVNK